jgi:hypothetical protein
MKIPTYREILADCFPVNPEDGINGVRINQPMREYRVAPGISGSDIKNGSQEFTSFGNRGHFTRIANDRIARWCTNNNIDLPVGIDYREETEALIFGSLYHCVLLTPGEFDNEFAVLTPEMLSELTERRLRRKEGGLPEKYSGNSKEAQEYKRKHGNLPKTDEEKEEILAATRKRMKEEIENTFPQTEYDKWKQEQTSAGRLIIKPAMLEHVRRMVDAMHDHPESSEVGTYLREMKLQKKHKEVGLFAVASFGSSGNEFHVQTKGRLDILPAGDAILDPKTCLSAHPLAFGKQVEMNGYDFSMASYIRISQWLEGHPEVAAYDFPKKRAGFLAQEKVAPFIARIFWLPEDWIQAETVKYNTEIQKLASLYKRGKWSADMMEAQEQTLEPSSYKVGEIDLYSGFHASM